MALAPPAVSRRLSGLALGLRADLGPLPVYRWAQYLSGIVGGLALAGWTARWWRRAPVATDARGRNAVALVGVAVVWAMTARRRWRPHRLRR